jgi:RimJ/RimL family protein N-acetyltransferase
VSKASDPASTSSGSEGPLGQPEIIGYPFSLVGDATTRTGTRVHLRPIRPDDGPRLVDFHQHLSFRSVYRRFFSVHPNLSTAEVEQFTCVDYVDQMALIAEQDQRLVGVGRYVRIPDTHRAEVAFVVADQHQNSGIGTVLLEHLVDAARDRGITTFVAMTLAENRQMLNVFAASGFPVSTSLEDNVVSVSFPITCTETSGVGEGIPMRPGESNGERQQVRRLGARQT